MFAALWLAATVAAPPSPFPTPTSTPVPAYSLDGAFSIYSSNTAPVNTSGALDTASGVDLPTRTDVSNALLTLSKNTGRIRGSVTVGAYAFPVLGFALNPTTQPGSNSYLFGFVPQFDLQYVFDAHTSVSIGAMTSLLGQESAFTYQNLDIERGLLWDAENTLDRGIRVAYQNGPWSATIGYNDGFYSGSAGRALEGDIAWTPTANTTWQFAFLYPGANTPPNASAPVANKREADFELTQQFGKLQLLPYVLVVTSPASPAQGYLRNESALGAALLANYAFSSAYALAFRYETFSNASARGDVSPNADLVGLGAGSSAQTLTLTPSYASGLFFARADFSKVYSTAMPSGAQSRVVFEAGVKF